MRNKSMFAAFILATAALCWRGLTSVATVTEPLPEKTDDTSIPSMPQVGKPLHCVIKGEAKCKLGEVPIIKVSLVNQTDSDIYLVGSLDTSDCKWRYPYCYFEVIGPHGKPATKGIGRCGNMNTLRMKDFVKVAPDKSFDPYAPVDNYGFFSAHQLSKGTFSQPGEYRVRFVYSTASEDIAKWGGDGRAAVADNAELVALFKQVPKTEVRSDEFIVNVEAPVE